MSTLATATVLGFSILGASMLSVELGISVAIIEITLGVVAGMVLLQPWFFARYGRRVIEPEIKGAFAVLFLLMWTADLAKSHAVLPAFLLGLAVARIFKEHPEEQRRFRVVAFSLLTPFFFFKGGLNVSLVALAASLPLLIGFFVAKVALKFLGVLPVALRYVRPHAAYTTLLMSTGLTFGTISSLYGLNAGIIDRTQFSVLVTTVILPAVVPTYLAARFFSPPVHALTVDEMAEVEDEEFEPPAAPRPKRT